MMHKVILRINTEIERKDNFNMENMQEIENSYLLFSGG